MKSKTLLYNALIHTQDRGRVVTSMAIDNGVIVAVGDRLERDEAFGAFERVDLKKRAVIPGLVDAHTHFLYYALSLGRVDLHGAKSIRECLARVKKFAGRLGRSEWIVGEGYAPDSFDVREEPDRFMLDEVSGGRPAFLYSKDQHSAWVNSKALAIAGITRRTKDPAGGEIVRLSDGEPSGILREGPAIGQIHGKIPEPSRKNIDRLYREALDIARKRGVTGVHSFDGPSAFVYFTELAERGKLGLRINYYPQAAYLSQLRRNKVRYGQGDAFLRIAGIKIFADGALGSRTALCFNRYRDSRDNCGIEVTTTEEMTKIAKSAARLGLPCAVHAIGDRAVANVLDAFERAPLPKPPARHRIEHLQLVRRKDIARLKRMNVVASMQPQQTLSDIGMMRKVWGAQARNAYIHRTLLDRGIDLALGSDVPIEPLDPLAGIAAAVRRAFPGSRDVFLPEQRITAAEALYGFTAGAAVAAGQANCRGFLLPGYPADFVLLSHDITRIAPLRLYDVAVLATVLDGHVTYCAPRISL